MLVLGSSSVSIELLGSLGGISSPNLMMSIKSRKTQRSNGDGVMAGFERVVCTTLFELILVIVQSSYARKAITSFRPWHDQISMAPGRGRDVVSRRQRPQTWWDISLGLSLNIRVSIRAPGMLERYGCPMGQRKAGGKVRGRLSRKPLRADGYSCYPIRQPSFGISLANAFLRFDDHLVISERLPEKRRR